MTGRTGAGTLGIYGGTFNPIHLGHLRAAEEVAEQLGLERVLFVPSGTPPHKTEERMAPALLRLDWARRAVAGNKRFEVDALEVERTGPSYSVDTVREIGARIAPALPVFVIGCDALVELETWHEPARLLELAHVAVVARPGDGRAPTLARCLPAPLAAAFSFAPDGLSARHLRAGTSIRWLEIEALPISSTDVRARIRLGRSIRYLVPEAIHDEILACAEYAGTNE
jgi:nicotinate-nucleotide adenylyltransferase